MAHYVSNSELLAHLKKRKAAIKKALEEGKDPPPIDNYIGKVILDIANRLSYRPNFINYSYKQEMIGDGVENCLKVVDNFDCENYSNPFAFYTRIIWNAFVRRIQMEQKQQHVKGCLISEMQIDEMFETQETDEDGIPYAQHMNNFLLENNFLQDTLTEPKKKKKEKSAIEMMMDDDE